MVNNKYKRGQENFWHTGRIIENDLTAFVFRVLNIVPGAKERFFEKLKEINKGREVPEIDKDPDVTFKPWPAWEIKDKEVKEIIVKLEGKEKGSVTPDAQIESSGCVIIIESECNKDYETKQLIGQFLTVESTIDEARDKYYLLVNNRWSRPGRNFKEDVKNCFKECVKGKPKHPLGKNKTRISRLPKELLWFNWQRFGAIFEELLEGQYKKDERSPASFLLRECISLLRKKGIISLKPFEIESALSKRRLRDLLDRLAVRININLPAKNRLIQLHNDLKSRPLRILEELSDRKDALINLTATLTYAEANGNGQN